MNQKTILLATLGKAPQIITETLYAIHQEGLDWPDEVVIITNRQCKDIAIKALLPTAKKDKSIIQLLCKETEHPIPKFNESSFHIITENESFDDFLKVENDIENFIMEEVRKLTENKEHSIHAVYTGGIKSMAAMLCRSMDFLGRPKDLLSSVFVSPAYQGCEDFYYPRDQIVTLNKGRENEEIANAIDAKITLRTTKPLPYGQNKSTYKYTDFNNFSFLELIKCWEYTQNPENIYVTFICESENVRIQVNYLDTQISTILFNRNKLEFSFFYMISAQYKCNNPLVRTSRKKQYKHDLANQYFDFHKKIFGDNITATMREKTISSLEEKGFTPGRFSDLNDKLIAHLQMHIPSTISHLISPCCAADSEIRTQEGFYTLKIPAANISFHHKGK